MDEVKLKIRTILEDYLKPERLQVEAIPEDADIRMYGIDSVNSLELFAEIESQFGICFDGSEIDFSCQNSIESIAHLVFGKL